MTDIYIGLCKTHRRDAIGCGAVQLLCFLDGFWGSLTSSDTESSTLFVSVILAQIALSFYNIGIF